MYKLIHTEINRKEGLNNHIEQIKNKFRHRLTKSGEILRSE